MHDIHDVKQENNNTKNSMNMEYFTRETRFFNIFIRASREIKNTFLTREITSLFNNKPLFIFHLFFNQSSLLISKLSENNNSL